MIADALVAIAAGAVVVPVTYINMYDVCNTGERGPTDRRERARVCYRRQYVRDAYDKDALLSQSILLRSGAVDR